MDCAALTLKTQSLTSVGQMEDTCLANHSEVVSFLCRRKLHIRGLTFDELVNSILGFSNPGNVPYLLSSLRQGQESSLMRGLYR